MSVNYDFESLSYRDPRATFAQQVMSCPAYMAVREAVQNAIEAATDPEFMARFGVGVGEIEFTETPGEDVDDGFSGRKFGVLSYGRGMTWSELVTYTDIGAGYKSRRADGNFGIGMKLAGLAASPAGVVIRTYNPDYRDPGLEPDDCIAEVMLAGHVGEDGEMRYGRAKLSPENPTDPCVRILSKQDFPSRNWDLPWTEVVFIGMTPDADTVSGMFAQVRGLYGNQFWTAAAVNCRYYSLPAGLCVRRANISQSNSASQVRNAFGLYEAVVNRWSCPEDGGNHSTIMAAHPQFGRCVITYGLLAAGADNGRSCASTLQAYGIPIESMGAGHAALVYRGEIYDHRFGKLWGSVASKFGLPHGQRLLYVHIELIDDIAQPKQDRTALRTKKRPGVIDSYILLEDFADIVKHPDHMPGWVRDYMERVSSGSVRSETLQEELRELIRQMKAQDRTANRATADDEGEESDAVDLPGGGLDDPRSGDKPGRNPPLKKRKGRARPIQDIKPPEVEWVTIEASDGKFTTERQGAHYDADANLLRLNREYRGFREHLESIWQDEGADDETARSQIEKVLQDEYGFRVASHIVSALHNRNAAVIEPAALDAIFSPANFICLMTTFDRVVRMGFRERYRRVMRRAQHG